VQYDLASSCIKLNKIQRYVTLGVPWAAARRQNNYESVGVPQTATRCQETYIQRTVFPARYNLSLWYDSALFVLYGSRFFPHTALNDWFLKPCRCVFTAWYGLSLWALILVFHPVVL
jgi:hypothetical protein